MPLPVMDIWERIAFGAQFLAQVFRKRCAGGRLGEKNAGHQILLLLR